MTCPWCYQPGLRVGHQGFLRGQATYDDGGFLKPGWTAAYNGTGRPEIVAPDQAITRALERSNGGGLHVDNINARMDWG